MVDIVVQKVAVLLVFAMALLFLNLRAGTDWLKVITLWPMLFCFGIAGGLVVEWVFL